jgi:predicted PurR-regulated permease PerM
MNTDYKPNTVLEMRMSRKLLDVFIRFGLVLVLTVLCYAIFAPFISLMVWAVILAVTLYPAHQGLSHRMNGKPKLAATLIVLSGVVLIVLPAAVLMSSLADSIHDLVVGVKDNTIEVPAPPDSVAAWPVVGAKVHSLWSLAHDDLPSFVGNLQPKVGELARKALGMVASLGGTMLVFLAAFVVAGIIMVFGAAGAESARDIFKRLVGPSRGVEFVRLATATIRAVAMGVVGVASIQAIVIGLVMMVAGIPFAGALAGVVLVLAVAQVPVLLVTLPAIAYIWMGSGHGTVASVLYTVLLFLGGVLDNVLKPMLLGRGVDAPMPVVLLGALGGLASAGILGMFVGATLLTLGYQIFMSWVASDPDATSAAPTDAAG